MQATERRSEDMPDWSILFRSGFGFIWIRESGSEINPTSQKSNHQRKIKPFHDVKSWMFSLETKSSPWV
jgi:hypothetical protein